MEKIGEIDDALNDLYPKIQDLQAEMASLKAQALDEADLKRAVDSFTPIWKELFPAEQARIINLLIEKVIYDSKSNEVEITFRPGGVRVLAEDKEDKTEKTV